LTVTVPAEKAEKPKRVHRPVVLDDQFYRTPATAKFFDVSKQTIFEWLKDEKLGFPRPIRLGKNSIAWRRSALEKWVASRPVA
jgi:predicted DNA-binding transcriptional regulator AlpA